jgi:hypothetical protein
MEEVGRARAKVPHLSRWAPNSSSLLNCLYVVCEEALRVAGSYFQETCTLRSYENPHSLQLTGAWVVDFPPFGPMLCFLWASCPLYESWALSYQADPFCLPLS